MGQMSFLHSPNLLEETEEGRGYITVIESQALHPYLLLILLTTINFLPFSVSTVWPDTKHRLDTPAPPLLLHIIHSHCRDQGHTFCYLNSKSIFFQIFFTMLALIYLLIQMVQ